MERSTRLRIGGLVLPLLLLGGCCGKSGTSSPAPPPGTSFEADSADLCAGVTELCQAIEANGPIDPERGVELCELASSLVDRVPDGERRGTIRGHLLTLGYMADDWNEDGAPPADFCMEGLQVCSMLGHLQPE